MQTDLENKEIIIPKPSQEPKENLDVCDSKDSECQKRWIEAFGDCV